MQLGSFWNRWLPYSFQTRADKARLACVCLLVWLVAGLVAGCGVSTAASVTSAGGITSFHIARTSAFPANHIPPFERTVVDARQAVKVYTALQALPVFPKGVMNCPADFGVAYHLTFFRDQSNDVSWARVESGGCEGVQLADGSMRWAATSKAFWQTLADAVGVPVSALFVVPGGNGASSAGELSASIKDALL